MRILLTYSNENNGLAGSVDHVERGADFFVNRVELGKHDPVNSSRIRGRDSVVNEALVELSQLIDCVVANKCLAHKKHNIRLV